MTNAEAIRQMTNDELAELLRRVFLSRDFGWISENFDDWLREEFTGLEVYD